MRFGIRLLQHLGKPEELLQLTVLAEQAGFDQVWYPHDAFMYNTWALTSAAAMRTERIHIASIATNPYTTDPSEIATYLATLDLLSNGRAMLGLGMHTEKMVAWTGHEAGDYVEVTRRSASIIRRLLAGEVVDDRSETFHWSDQCYLRFEPLREDVPLYIAAFGQRFMALSGEIGDGSLPMITPPESAPAIVSIIQEGAKSAERSMNDVDIAGCAWLSLSSERSAAADTLRPIVAYFGPYFEDHALATIGLTSDDFAPIKTLVDEGSYREAAAAVSEEMLRLAIVGTTSDVIDRINYLEEVGITQVNLGGPLGPDPAAAIRLMGEAVIPQFR